eukprot:scaffold17184_cov76-Phaeocystis_antarctica.AAC.2
MLGRPRPWLPSRTDASTCRPKATCARRRQGRGVRALVPYLVPVRAASRMAARAVSAAQDREQ